MKATKNHIRKIEVVFYPPTQTKGDRIRLLGESNKFVAYDYRFNSALDMALTLLKGYEIIEIIPTKRGGVIFVSEPVYSLESDEIMPDENLRAY
jgi:hypothetical protein